MSETLGARRSAPKLKAGLGLIAAAVSHAGWWLEWQLRIRAGEGCRQLQDQEV
jgi:hypothetical protein